MSLVDTVRSKRRKAVIIGMLVTLLAFLLLLALNIYAGPWAVIIGFLVYFKMVRTGKIVVWLRRFHRNEPNRLRFNMLLNRACPGLCIPITIQDSAFKTSYYSSGASLLVIAPLVFGLGTLLYLLCAITIFVSLIALGVSDNIALFLGLVLSIGPLLLYIKGVRTYMARRGHVVLQAKKAREKAEDVLQRIRVRKLAFHGVLILKCVDEVWHDMVRFLLSKADAVIIDVSELSENLMWELETAIASPVGNSMLLTCEVLPDMPQELPESVRSKLENILGPERLSGLRVLYYPAQQPPPGPNRGRMYTRLSKELMSQLAKCIEAPTL